MFIASVAINTEYYHQVFGTHSMLVLNSAAVETALRSIRPLAVADQVTESPTPISVDSSNSHLPFLQPVPSNMHRL